MRRLLSTGLLCAMLLVPTWASGAESTGVVETPHNIVGSSELVEQPGLFDGLTVVFSGEAIGEAMVRGEWAWLHVNDDAYTDRNVEEGAELGGFNSGLGIWIPAAEAEKIEVFGDYLHQGDIVQIKGVFNAACREHGGDMDLHAMRLDVLRVGHHVVDEVRPEKVYWALGLGLLALVAFLGWRRTLDTALRRGGAGRRLPKNQ